MHFLRYLSSRMSFSQKVGVLLLSFAALMSLILGVTSYLLIPTYLEHIEGEKLEAILKTAALSIPGETHELVVQAHVNQDSEIVSRAPFQQVHKELAALKKAHSFKSDPFTFMRPDWSSQNLMSVGSSSPGNHVGRSISIDSESIHALEKGLTSHTRHHWKNKDLWISAYAPIMTSSGKVVAMLGIHHSLKDELEALRKLLLMAILIYTGTCALIVILLGHRFGRSALFKPIQDLIESVQAASNGRFSLEMGKKKGDEVSDLTLQLVRFLKETHHMADTLIDQKHQLEREISDLEEKSKFFQRYLNTLFLYESYAIFAFDQSGVCLFPNSPLCQKLLEIQPAGKTLWEVLKYPENSLRSWVHMLFVEAIPFSELARLGPKYYPHSNGKKIQMEYQPIRDENQSIVGVVVIVRETTQPTLESTVKLEEEAPTEQPIQKFFTHAAETIQNSVLKENKKLLPVTFRGGNLAIHPDGYMNLFQAIETLFLLIVKESIETIPERKASGKPEAGMITVYFTRQNTDQSSSLVIAVQDDGRGIRSQKDDPPFDPLTTEVSRIGGILDVRTKPDKGTLVTITVPYLKGT